MFSREFCEISRNTFSYRTPLVAASIHYRPYYETGWLHQWFPNFLFHLLKYTRSSLWHLHFQVLITFFCKGGNFFKFWLESLLLGQNFMPERKFACFFKNTSNNVGSKFGLYFMIIHWQRSNQVISLKWVYLGFIQEILHEISVRHKI